PDAARPSRRLASEALAARHPPRRGPAAAARLLPRRVHLSLQPSRLQPPRSALLPAPRTGCADRAAASGDHRRRGLIARALAAKDMEADSPLRECPRTRGWDTR